MANPLIVLLGFSSLILDQSGFSNQEAPKRVSKVKAPIVALLPAVPGRGLQQVPNITIKYYDVSGKNYADVIQSIEKQRPRDPASNQLMVGGASWSLGANMTQVTRGKVCTVTGAKAEFSANAELPRLVNEQAMAPKQLANWRAYLSQIEVPAAAGLWYVIDRIPAFEKSMVGKDCAGASAFANAAIAQLKREQEAYQLQLMTAAAAAPASARAPAQAPPPPPPPAPIRY